jgi:hypothetical protein
MKYIVTKKQFNLLTESRGTQFFQDFIDKTLKYIQEGCDKSYDEFPNNISFDTCDVAELVEEIKLVSIDKNQNGSIILNVNIIFTSIKKYVNFDELIDNLERIIRKKFGISVIIKENEQKNKKLTFDW